MATLGAWLIKLFGILLIAYGTLALGMFFMQRKLLYIPGDVPTYSTAKNLRDLDVIRLTTEDGEHLMAWYKPARAGYPTIIYFHGNAGSLHDRIDKFRHLTDQGFGMLGVSYRGYGGSTGTPTENGLFEDARTAVAYALKIGITPERMIYYGESLGSGVAVETATHIQPAAIFLEAPYTSVANRAQEIYPYVPVKLLLKDHFDSISKISNITAPVLIIHGDADETIPIAHGKQLAEAAGGEVTGIWLEGIGHTDFDLERMAKDLEAFANKHGLIVN